MFNKILSCIFSILFFASFTCNADDNFKDLFKLSPSNVETNQEQTALPFKTDCQEQGDYVLCKIAIDDKAYIYKDSINISVADGLIQVEDLPDGEIHKDLNGSSYIFTKLCLIRIHLLNIHKGEQLQIQFQGCDANGICYPPQTETHVIQNTIESKLSKNTSKIDEKDSLFKSSDSFAFILILCLVFGAALDLTPCVLPMLSIYSATILGSTYTHATHKLKQNLSYILGLSLTYCVLGLVFAQIGIAAHGVLQHPISIVLMAILLLIFALDCAGVISLKIPMLFNNSLQIAINKQKNGTMAKAFIFGALSALITTPCTSAPLAGALVYIVTSNSIAKGVLMFLFIGLGMGLPLLVIGTYGSKFLSHFKSRVSQIRHLFAIPLILGAFFISKHLFGTYALYIEPCLYIVCFAYFLAIVLQNKKIVSIIVAGFVAFFVMFSAFYGTQTKDGSENFIKLVNYNSLNKFVGTPTLITVSANWCTNCHELDATLYASDEFLDMTKNINKVRFDFSDPNTKDNIKLTEKLNIIGVPFVAVLDKKGNLVGHFTGTIDQKELHKLIDKVK